ncbi:MAG: hypothetical protein MI920_24005 [Kiloniellales bacterium]|nr:hypothetical protein [Kiloniellales bacterium]
MSLAVIVLAIGVFIGFLENKPGLVFGSIGGVAVLAFLSWFFKRWPWRSSPAFAFTAIIIGGISGLIVGRENEALAVMAFLVPIGIFLIWGIQYRLRWGVWWDQGDTAATIRWLDKGDPHSRPPI